MSCMEILQFVHAKRIDKRSRSRSSIRQSSASVGNHLSHLHLKQQQTLSKSRHGCPLKLRAVADGRSGGGGAAAAYSSGRWVQLPYRRRWIVSCSCLIACVHSMSSWGRRAAVWIVFRQWPTVGCSALWSMSEACSSHVLLQHHIPCTCDHLHSNRLVYVPRQAAVL